LPGDARAIAEAEVASWRAAYADLMPAGYLAALSEQDRAQSWREDLEKHGQEGRKRTWVVEDDGRVAGFSLAGQPSGAPEGVGLLYFLYFRPEAWGQGLATVLMGKVMADLREQAVTKAHLWVLEENLRARKFYERLGWRPDGGRRIDAYGGVSLGALRYVVSI
jgi:RimJ/RimL family protein N-acetyltransferase